MCSLNSQSQSAVCSILLADQFKKILILITLNMLNVLNGLVHLPFLKHLPNLYIKMRNCYWLANSIEPRQNTWACSLAYHVTSDKGSSRIKVKLVVSLEEESLSIKLFHIIYRLTLSFKIKMTFKVYINHLSYPRKHYIYSFIEFIL